MDSLTQIVLGAACGELVAGKKLGNRSILWGAIGGTIPDLDVSMNLFFDHLYATKYHRHISHSLFFALLFPWLMAYITQQYYKYRPQLKWVTLVGLIAAVLGILYALNGGVVKNINAFSIGFSGVVIGLSYWFFRHYSKEEFEPLTMTYKDWVKLFFWAILTHPILDCFTTYGTQLFQPFHNYRVSFNAVSVVDPIYTIPFLILVVIAMFKRKESKVRRKLVMAGVIVSSLYLVFAVANKFQVESYLDKEMTKKGISYNRISTTPTIMNNILWAAIVETDEGYYLTEHSILRGRQAPLAYIHFVDKNHFLFDKMKDERIDILKWLSKGFYRIDQQEENLYRWSDLRFGRIPDGNFAHSDDFLFTYTIKTDGDKVKSVTHKDADFELDFPLFWKRIKGVAPILD